MGSSDARDPRNEVDAAELSRSTHSMRLVRQLRHGDRAAMNELLERYGPRMERVIRVKLHAQLRRHIDPEDIVQEVLLIASQKVGDIELRTDASILQWLSKIAVTPTKLRNQDSFSTNLLRTVLSLFRSPTSRPRLSKT